MHVVNHATAGIEENSHRPVLDEEVRKRVDARELLLLADQLRERERR